MIQKEQILFIAASPNDLSIVEWDAEYKVMTNSLKYENYEYILVSRATAKDLNDHFYKKYWLIHFTGHGKDGKKIILENDGISREPFIYRGSDFVEFISTIIDLKCVVLSACQSDQLAHDLLQNVDFIIAFKGNICNADAVEFASKFYKNLDQFKVIPSAYKETIRQLTNEKYRGEINPVFLSRHNFLLNELKEDRNQKLKEKYAGRENVLREIQLLEKDIASIKNSELKDVKKNLQELFYDLLKKCPYPHGTFWFSENQESLAGSIAMKVLFDHDINTKEYFSKDLNTLLNYLKDILVTNDFQEFTEGDIKESLVIVVDKKYYEYALDLIPTFIPPNCRGEFETYLKNSCNYIKKLL